MGAVLALLGCAVGNLLTIAIIISQHQSIPFMDVVTQLDFDLVTQLMTATFNAMDVLFYGLAIYEGYKFSFRKLTDEELAQLV